MVVGTPDHTHAPAAAMAMRLGKHCYCEKPLTHTVYEARVLADLAREKKLATQMGTQIHAGANYRRVVELVQAGRDRPGPRGPRVAGGELRRPAQAGRRPQPDAPKDTPPVPGTLDWDLWLGPAPFRPYHPTYVPSQWRDWWAFGNGTLGDFFCHYCDLAFWALELRHPTTVEADGPVHPESAAHWTIARQEYPARGNQPPVALTWYNGGGIRPGSRRRKSAVGQRRAVRRRRGACSSPTTAGTSCCPRRNSRTTSRRRRRSPIRSAITPNGSGPARRAAHHLQLRLRRGVDRGGAVVQRGPANRQEARMGRRRLKAANCPEADRFLRQTYRPGWTL